MDKDERTTHFRKFAELLFEEMLGTNLSIDVSSEWSTQFDPTDEQYQKYIDLIAKRAYDLVRHNLNRNYANYYPRFLLTADDLLQQEHDSHFYLPDMTELPPLDDN